MSDQDDGTMAGTHQGHWFAASLDRIDNRLKLARVAERLLFHDTSIAAECSERGACTTPRRDPGSGAP